jgi:predicted transcriptional regulator
MREIIQSIRPRWTGLIFKEIKILELRKSKPVSIEYPFKVYIYETKQGMGAVVGEYICRKIISINDAGPVVENSCVPVEDIKKYMGKGKLFGWNISDVYKYTVPKPLSKFGLLNAPQSWCYTEVDKF